MVDKADEVERLTGGGEMDDIGDQLDDLEHLRFRAVVSEERS